ncbi:hypothetical protein [Acidovorax sp. LjRoot194]|uniref:hypothetical protein n=1 Tax=Acidovorax sp. LjRoot194 TaxID=3342280 RepID=UPI003ECF9134
MRLIAFRITLLAIALMALAVALSSPPLEWIAGALMVISIAAILAALTGMEP